MLKLPAYEAEVAPSPDRRIVEGVRAPAADGLANGLAALGEGTFELVRRLQEAQTDREVAGAEARAKDRIDRWRFEVEKDQSIPDDQLVPTVRETSERILNEEAGKISSPHARKIWLEHRQSWLGEGDLQAEKLGWKRGIDRATAAHVEAEADLEKKAGDPALTAETYRSLIEGRKAVIQRDVQRGFVGPDDAARLGANLETLAAKDRKSRLSAEVEGLVRAGNSKAADEVIANSGVSLDERASLKRIKESTESALRAEADRKEREIREAQELASNKLEVEILDGIAGRLDIDKAVAQGRISPNAQPALIRAERVYREWVTNSEKLDALTRQTLIDQSKDRAVVLKYLPSEIFKAGPGKWGKDLDAIYEQLLPDDRRVIVEELAKRQKGGQSVSEVNTTFNALIAQAKRIVPPEWKIGSESEPAATPMGQKFRGVLGTLAERSTDAVGGEPLTMEQGRKVIAQALVKTNPDKYPLPMSMVLENLGVDLDLATVADVSARLQKKLGRMPTPQETLTEYDRLQKQ